MTKLLIVEDNFYDYETFCDILEDEEFEIIQAKTLVEAKEKIEAKDTKFDLALVDINLDDRGEGNTDGLEFLKYANSKNDLDLPIIIFTNNFGATKEGKRYSDIAKEYGLPREYFKNKADTSNPDIIISTINDILQKKQDNYLRNLNPIDYLELKNIPICFPIHEEDHRAFIHVNDILYVEAAGNSSKLTYKKNKEIVVKKVTLQLGVIKRELFKYHKNLYRCSNSYIINLENVTGVNKTLKRVFFNNNVEIHSQVSDTNWKEFTKRCNLYK